MSEPVDASKVISIAADGDEYVRPEQFCFSVEVWQDTPIATICPIEYFQQNGYLDDAYYNDINELLENNKFFAVLEAAYEFDDEAATVESATAKMLELGFKQVPEFDQYISQTNADFSIATLAAASTAEAKDEQVDAEAIDAPLDLLKALEEDDSASGER